MVYGTRVTVQVCWSLVTEYTQNPSSQLSILISLYFFLSDYVFGCLQIDLSTKWNVFSITEIHKRQFHSFICILHHCTWLYHDFQIIRKMGIILLLWSIHMIKSMNFNFVQAAANMFSYFKTKVQLHLEVEYQKNIRLHLLAFWSFLLRFYQEQILQIKSCFHYNLCKNDLLSLNS